MIRGVSFKIPQKTTNTLCGVLKAINVSDYSWYYIKSQSEVWDQNGDENFFKKIYYNGVDFSKCIQNSHYAIFLKLQAYYGPHIFYEINSYEDYITSDCKIIVLLYDCEFVEIFTKDTIISNSIFEKAKQIGYDNIMYITEDNNTRTKMTII